MQQFLSDLKQISRTLGQHQRQVDQGNEMITGADVRALLQSLQSLESQCADEQMSFEDIDAVTTDAPKSSGQGGFAVTQ